MRVDVDRVGDSCFLQRPLRLVCSDLLLVSIEADSDTQSRRLRDGLDYSNFATYRAGQGRDAAHGRTSSANNHGRRQDRASNLSTT